MYETVVGLDLGHSAIKMTFDGRNGVTRTLTPSVACTAIALNNEVEAEAARRETVSVGDRDFFVGDTALLQGRGKISTGLSADWIETPEHAALLRYGKKMVDEQAGDGRRLYVLGLPIRQYGAAGKQRLRTLAAETLELEREEDVHVVPQPMGGYYAFMFDRNGLPQSGRSLMEESWAVIDVGYYSSDFVLLVEGHWIEQACDGCDGVRVAAEELQRLVTTELGVDVSLLAAEKALTKGTIRRRGKVIDIKPFIERAGQEVATQVADMAKRLLEPYIDEIDGVLIIGGGADLVLPELKRRWDHAQHIPDRHPHAEHSGSRFLVSEGYYRFGRHKVFIEQAG